MAVIGKQSTTSTTDEPKAWTPPRDVFKVVVTGGPGVGKTSLVQLLTGSIGIGIASLASLPARELAAGAGKAQAAAGPLPTVGTDFCTRSVFIDGPERPVRLHLWDTSGQERFRSVVEPCLIGLEDHDAVIVVYDVSSAESLEQANTHILRVRKLAKGAPQIALVACKCDLAKREDSALEGRARAAELGVPFFAEVSCPSGKPPGTRLPGEALSTHTQLEEKLLRPLLRRCRECATTVADSIPLAPLSSRAREEPHCATKAKAAPRKRCSLLWFFGFV